MDSVIWGFIGTLVGALASIGTTWISSISNSNLHKQASEQERKERERSFQRNTLLELQDALSDVLRMITQAHIEDVNAYRINGNWGNNMISDEVNEGELAANRKASILIERVANDKLRTELKEIIILSSSVCRAISYNDAKNIFSKVNMNTKVAMENLGAALRNLY